MCVYVYVIWAHQGDLDGSSCVYISTQAPVPLSVADFWRMVWEQRSSIIVMLTALRERDRVKSDAYWLDDPEQQPLRCGQFDVRLVERVKVRVPASAAGAVLTRSCIQTGDIIHRKFELTNRDVRNSRLCVPAALSPPNLCKGQFTRASTD